MGNHINDAEKDEFPANLADIPDIPEPDAAFRKKVWRRTAASLRWRSRRRRLLSAAVMALAYTAGLATMHVMSAPSGTTRAFRISQGIELNEGEQERITERTSEGDALVGGPLATADLLLDREAFAQALSRLSEEGRMKLLKAAGDRYLRDLGDVESALDCYRWLLNLTEKAEQPELDTGDSWLLAALRQARQKEATHEKTCS